MYDREWLDSLKKGDLVLVKYGFNQYERDQVQRATKTQIVIKGSKFRRQDGFLVAGDVYSRSHIAKPTPKLLEKIRRNKLIDRIKSLNWSNYSAPALAQVLSLLSKQDEKEKETEKPHDQPSKTE